MLIYCKKCGGEFEVDDGADFTESRCPDCGGEFTTEKPGEPMLFPCPACGKMIARSAKSCPHCGAFLWKDKKSVRNCPQCGRRLSPRAVICPGCGIQFRELQTKPSISNMVEAGCLVLILWTLFSGIGIWVCGAAIFGGLFAATRPASAQTQQVPAARKPTQEEIIQKAARGLQRLGRFREVVARGNVIYARAADNARDISAAAWLGGYVRSASENLERAGYSSQVVGAIIPPGETIPPKTAYYQVVAERGVITKQSDDKK